VLVGAATNKLGKLMRPFHGIIAGRLRLLVLSIIHHLPSNRRHLSCGDCLEDKRADCTILHTLHSYKHTHNEQFLQVYYYRDCYSAGFS